MLPGGWRLECVDGLTLLRCEALREIAGLAHGFSTRRADDGVGFDLGTADDRGEPMDSRRRRFCAAVGVGERLPPVLRQVHGNRVVSARQAVSGPEADAVVAVRGAAGVPLAAVRTADCLPVLLAEAGGLAVAAVHCGWRGTAAGVLRCAVRALAGAGVPPSGLRAALGPAIGPCCYEVGAEVVEAVARASGTTPGRIAHAAGTGGGPRLDLASACHLQLLACGLQESAIHTAGQCTRCDPGLYFSYRREGRDAGRMMACIGWSGATRRGEAAP